LGIPRSFSALEIEDIQGEIALSIQNRSNPEFLTQNLSGNLGLFYLEAFVMALFFSKKEIS